MEISDEEEQHKIGNIGNDVEETSNTPTESATNRRREICRRRDCNLSFDSDGGGGFKTGVWVSWTLKFFPPFWSINWIIL